MRSSATIDDVAVSIPAERLFAATWTPLLFLLFPLFFPAISCSQAARPDPFDNPYGKAIWLGACAPGINRFEVEKRGIGMGLVFVTPIGTQFDDLCTGSIHLVTEQGKRFSLPISKCNFTDYTTRLHDREGHEAYILELPLSSDLRTAFVTNKRFDIVLELSETTPPSELYLLYIPRILLFRVPFMAIGYAIASPYVLFRYLFFP